MGGWTRDDVCVYAPATADNRLGVDDFVATDRGGPIGLTWTNPKYGPVQEVVVVKRADRFPAGHDDGQVVVDLTGPEVGQAVDVEDPNADGSSGYYAVYGFDGAEWSSYTIDGMNADYAAPNGGGTATTPTGPADTVPLGEDEPGGCGCAASPAAAGWLWAPLALLALRRRSR
jgi:MYXO-CTERM domain-containing protein